MGDHMKTTIEINDELLTRAKEACRREGKTLREIVEAGLRLALKSVPARPAPKRLPVSTAQPGFTAEFADADWAQMKEEGRRR